MIIFSKKIVDNFLVKFKRQRWIEISSCSKKGVYAPVAQLDRASAF